MPPGYYYVPVRPPVPVSPGGLPLADFGTRLVAYIIDSLFMSVFALILAVPGLFLVLRHLPDPAQYADDTSPGRFLGDFLGPLLLFELALFVVMLVGYYLYSVEYAHRGGQTLGKKAMKIRIVPLDPHLRYTRGMAAKRFLIEYVGGVLVPFFSYLDGLWQLWDKPYQQALHDKVAGTVVVKVSP
ncbi:hypothetical protein GCM10010172_27810 [Paractinoplanes ferrugineus]|uniref:RDD family protein n=1 Tax=Paractinoplanes ferrugineus TaxID=113564 RepID=A0A919IU92_9ACTN|nr:RDD family protein [Actinoplanes ferrugineus]